MTRMLRSLGLLVVVYFACVYVSKLPVPSHETGRTEPSHGVGLNVRASYYRALHDVGFPTPCDNILNHIFDTACHGYWK